MRVHVSDMIKVLMLKLYIHSLVNGILQNEEDTLKVTLSTFVELALDILDGKDKVIEFDKILSKVQSLLSRYFVVEAGIDIPREWPSLTSGMLLDNIDEKIILHITADGNQYISTGVFSYMYRQASKLLVVPMKVKVPSSNVSSDNSHNFEISVKGITESDVLSQLVTVLHNAYVRSFFYYGLVDSSELTTVNLMGSGKGELLDLFNSPNIEGMKKDVIIDARYLLPQTVYMLVKWVKANGLKQDQRLILIASRSNLTTVKYEVFEGLSVESYLIL